MKKTLIVLIVLLGIVGVFFNTKLFERNQKKDNNYKVKYKVAILADTHNNQEALKQAIIKAKSVETDYFIVLGDFTDYSEKAAFIEQKKILDEGNIGYCVIPGDHDIVGKKNEELNWKESDFHEVFRNKVCKSYIEEYKIATLINPYNYTLLKEELKDIKHILENKKVLALIMSQPIYNPKSNIYMGFFDKEVNKQAIEILKNIEKYTQQNNEITVISADTHFFSKYTKNKVNFYTIGALTNKKNLTAPNFAILEVYSNNSVKVKELLVN